MPDEFFSFDEALDELRLQEDELKRLVSEGDIRAFRKGDTMKLRRSDVDALRRELTGGDVVDLNEPAEELVFEDDAVGDEESGMATQEISDVDTLIDEDVEEIGELELEEEEAPAAASKVKRPRPTVVQEEEEVEGMGIRAAMIATALVFILGLPVALAISSGKADSVAKAVAEVLGGKIESAADNS
ncbi:MAG: hypothetical protein CMJ98_11935 [Planctomycetes bacterium]|nr:hypothetical protein [Planctomycetota bacterium]HJM57485.1 hypothetical protein [Planctomycetota bacterium]